MSRPGTARVRSEHGQITVLLLGFFAVLVAAVAVAVDAGAAYLQRQSLHSLADGAALHAVDAGATGEEVYDGGLTGDHLELTPARARAAVHDYLRDTGAHRHHAGLRAEVHVDTTAGRVAVRLRSRLDLPLRVPGMPDEALVTGLADAVARTRFE